MTKDVILVLNTGSSSVKFSVYAPSGDAMPVIAVGRLDGINNTPRLLVRAADGRVLSDADCPTVACAADRHGAAIEAVIGWLRDHAEGYRLLAVGHRVVHGGDRFKGPALIDAIVLAALDDLAPLAPLHQPYNLAAIRTIAQIVPDIPQVACCDTAFHQTQPDIARAFALPRALSREGIRRYGFHGLSYEYIARVLPAHAPAIANGRVVVAHLGNGASLCALSRRVSIASTMGFTALDGLPMGTRCGNLDPAVVLHLILRKKMAPEDVEEMLYERSGLLGVSDMTSDMRELLASENPKAKEAVALFTYRIVRELGSMAAALGGLDGLVFTGGIGENAAPIRARVCRDAAWLGIELNEAANASNDRRISTVRSPVEVHVIPTDEELILAQHTRTVGLGHSFESRP